MSIIQVFMMLMLLHCLIVIKFEYNVIYSIFENKNMLRVPGIILRILGKKYMVCFYKMFFCFLFFFLLFFYIFSCRNVLKKLCTHALLSLGTQ